MVSLLRFKHGGKRQTGAAVAASLRQRHTSGVWPVWLGDPLGDPTQAPGWDGDAATGDRVHDDGQEGGEAGAATVRRAVVTAAAAVGVMARCQAVAAAAARRQAVRWRTRVMPTGRVWGG